MTQSTDRREPAFIFESATETSSFRGGNLLTLRLRAVTTDASGGEIRNEIDSALGDLEISALAASDIAQDMGTYGWRVEFHNVYSVGLARAQTMVAALGKIERFLAKKAAADGAPQSFGQYAARVAQAVGATRILRQSGGTGTSYASRYYQSWTTGEAVALIDHTVRDWHRAQNPDALSA